MNSGFAAAASFLSTSVPAREEYTRHHQADCPQQPRLGLPAVYPFPAAAQQPQNAVLQQQHAIHLARLKQLSPAELQVVQAQLGEKLKTQMKQLPPAAVLQLQAASQAAPSVTSCTSRAVSGMEEESPYMTVLDAVKMGLFGIVRRLVEDTSELVPTHLTTRDAEGHSIMHWAAKKGNLDVVRLLADKGVPLFLPSDDKVGMQPLHWAVTEGHLSVVHFLMSQGADVNARDKQLCTPLLIAAQYGQTEVCAYLIKNGADTSLLDVNWDSAMHWAAYKGELTICQLLYNLGLPTNELDDYGQTPLHLAALRGNLSVVEYLVMDTEASTLTKDKSGCTPLDLSIKRGKFRVTSFLRQQSRGIFHWRQLLRWQQWRHWMQGGGTAEASVWPLYYAIFTHFYANVLYPARFFTETGISRLSEHGSLHAWSIGWQFSVWVFFLLAWRSDPGFVDAKSERERKDYLEALESYSREGMELMLQQGIKPKLTLCHSCHVKRPLRSKHCSIDRRCVKAFDHHCPFIGNCVGLNNYRWFFAYIFSVFWATVCVNLTSYYYLHNGSFDLYIFVSMVYIALNGIMVGMLVIYHMQLIAVNLTTNEHQNAHRYDYLKDGTGQPYNPFDVGCLGNTISRLFSLEASNNLVLRRNSHNLCRRFRSLGGRSRCQHTARREHNHDGGSDQAGLLADLGETRRRKCERLEIV